MFSRLLLVLLFRQSVAVIFSVNESEYQKMPPLFAMDDYEKCMLEPGGIFCVATYSLFSKRHSDLMHFIQEYSAHTMKHYNHTNIHRGLCLTTTCREYLTTKTEWNPETILGRCLNESIWKAYGIEAKLTELNYCKRSDDRPERDLSDYIVAVVYLLLIILNIIGSFYDIILCNKDNKKENQYLLAFSVKRNWAKLVAPGGKGPDPRLERLKLFNGLRAMTMVCVIFSHTTLTVSFSYVANPLYSEKAYDDPLKQLLFSGSVVTHTFFLMSSFLLAYNLQILAEKREINWTYIPKGILLRWIRLTPVYALVIATVATWVRLFNDGPFWQLMVTNETNSCRKYWWTNILYINNYFYSKELCLGQTWYLAADTQLFCLGLILLVLIQRSSYRKVALFILFLISLVIVAGYTYFYDLEALVIQAPEAYRGSYENDNTFKIVYISGHTNISTYTLGLVGGLLVYYWQKKEKDLSKYRKYLWAFYLLFPIGIAIILSGGFFYVDGYTPSMLMKVIYATFYKVLFQTVILFFIVGCIFKYESVYRGVVEWRGFTWAGRVSYSAFLLHTIFQRTYIGSLTELVFISDYFMIIFLCASLFLSFLCGALLWLLVEAPFAALSRCLFGK